MRLTAEAADAKTPQLLGADLLVKDMLPTRDGKAKSDLSRNEIRSRLRTVSCCHCLAKVSGEQMRMILS